MKTNAAKPAVTLGQCSGQKDTSFHNGVKQGAGPKMWAQEILMPEKEDAIDSQISRLEDYLLGNKQIVNAHEVAIEQALALAYIAKELKDSRLGLTKFLESLTILKEKA
jgi:hypothetical protein